MELEDVEMYQLDGCEDEPITSADDVTWETKDGRILEFKDMDDEYLRNAIKCCKKYGWPIPTLMIVEYMERKGLI